MQVDLVIRAQAGDHDAFATLAGASIDRLFATARLILRADAPADDAVQEALTRAWLGLRGLRDPARFDAWLRRLLVNACYRAARRESTRQVTEIRSLHMASPSMPDSAAAFTDRDQLERGFRRLTPEARAVLVLHHYLDLSDTEAAAALGVPIGTFKSRLNRATTALRAALEADEREPILRQERTR
jgi:RNA polymerase sigma-70 factor (ECF subfamily)